MFDELFIRNICPPGHIFLYMSSDHHRVPGRVGLGALACVDGGTSRCVDASDLW